MYKEITCQNITYSNHKIVAIESLESDEGQEELTVFSATILDSNGNFVTYRKGLNLDEAIDKCKIYINNHGITN